MKLNKTQESELQAKIATLIEQRDKLVEQANREIVFLNGRIGQLQELLDITPEPQAQPDED